MPVTLRTVADACGTSTATVSRALANHRYVKPELRTKIQQEAARQNYAPNRLVGTLMAHVRRARTHHFLGNLAIVHVQSARSARIGPQGKRIIESAQNRAKEIGYSLELFELQNGLRGETTLARVLRARGVAGAIFVYPEPSDALGQFPWDNFSSVAIDFARPEPLLNTVCHDHYASMTTALFRLQSAGYRRVGLFIEHFKDRRTNYKWSAAFRSFQLHHGGIGKVPVLMEEKITERAYISWFRKHRPDVTLGHYDDCIAWLDHNGRSVPQHVGFFNLNWLARTRPCAGIDPQLELQGRVAVDTLVSQVQHGERGLMPTPRLISVPGLVVPGPTTK